MDHLVIYLALVKLITFLYNNNNYYKFNRFLHHVKAMVNPMIPRTTSLTQAHGETFNLTQAHGDLTRLS